MKRTLCLILLFVGIGLSLQAQNWQSLTINPSKDSLELNPLKGLTPLYNVNNDFPHSIQGRIIGFDSVMYGLTDELINWDIFDRFLDTVAMGGRFGYLQVNVDMGFNRSDLPAFLSNVERYYYDGQDPADGAGVPSVVVNYNNEEMMTALLTFIEKFGEKYNDDPRVFLVHYGLYGIFGEWDIGFGKKFIPEGEEWEMTVANQRRITAAFEAAFDNKNLLARFPENVPEPQAVGYSDGLYFGGSISENPSFQWFFHPKLVANNADENWKIYPIGGEVDPDVQPTVWANYPNTVIGLPGQTQETDPIFELTHPTFLFQDFIFNDITKNDNPVMWENALKATRRTGYTFHINEYRISAANAKPAIEVNVQNTGLAPMYANWEVEYAYLDINDDIVSLGKSTTWNLRSIQPEVADNYRSFVSDVMIPDGSHTFLLRIINPLETISTSAKPVRFDNATQDADKLGWLTLGQATITSGSVGSPPVPVMDMTVSPATSTMGLFDELQLTATVLPMDATNPAITWSSNRPATASVDANGLVTTNTLGGEVVITAATQDGAIIKESNISVESFWVIPGRVEAEGFIDKFSAQVGPAPNGEESESVLGFIGDDTWMDYVVDVSEAADFVVDFRASSPAGIGTIEIIDENEDTLQSIAFSPATADFDTYNTYTTEAFNLPAGRYTLRFDVVTSAFNLNWLEFRLDPCTNFDVNLVGTSCDDGNANTTNDVYGDNCECNGTLIANFTQIPALIQAEDFFALNDAQVNPAPMGEAGGGDILGFIGDDTWMDYGIYVEEEAEFVIDLRAASPFGVSEINLLNDAGDTLSTLNLTPATANYDTYGTFTSTPFTLPVGEYRIRLDVVASAFNLNWLEFRYAVDCDGPRGSACDDGDANTVNDIYLVNCDCVGIPITAFTNIPGRIEAENYYELVNAQVNNAPPSEDGGSVLGFIGDNTYMEYGVTVSEAADFVLDFRAASPFAAGIINVLNEAGDSVTTIALTPATADYDTYSTYTTQSFSLPAGSYFLRLDVVASAFNLNWIEFRLVSPPLNYVAIPSLIQAEDYSDVFNAQVNPAPDGEPDGGDILGFIGDDTWMEYPVTVSETADFVLDFRAASPFGVSKINVLNEAGDSLTTIALTPATANYDTYGLYTTESFTLPAGNYVLRLDVVASAFNLNWIEFRLVSPPLNYVAIPSLIQAEDYSDVFNAQVNPAPNGEPGGGDILGFIGDDTWMEYPVTVSETADFVLDFRAASPFSAGIIDVLNEAGDSLTTIALTPATANYDTYGLYTTESFTLPAGNYVLRLDVVASAFNLNWIEFRLVSPPLNYVAIPSLIQAEDYSDVFNAQVNPAPNGEPGGGDILGFIGDDTWMEYPVTVSETADFVLDFRAASPFSAGIIDVLNEAGDSLTTIALTPATADYDTYGLYTTASFTLPAGSYVLRLDVVASAFNLNWIEFRLATPPLNYIAIPSLIQAEDYSDVFNAQVNPAPNGEPGGGDILGFIGDDTWMEYPVTVSETADFVLDFRAASPFSAGIIDVLNEAGDSLTTIALTPATADYDTYGLYTTASFTLPAGSYVLRLDVVASAFNLNWIEFRLATPPLNYIAIPSLIQAEDYSDVFNAQVNPAPNGEPGGGDILGFIGDDTWMEYPVTVSETADFVLDFRAASPFSAGIIDVLNEAGDSLTTIALTPSTADYDTYGLYTTASFTLPAGNYVLRLDVVASAFNLNWIEFRLATPPLNYIAIPSLIQAEDYSDVFNAQVNPAPNGEPGGGDILGFIGDDTWMEYPVTVSETADFVLDFRAASPFSAGIIDVLNEAGDSLTTIALTPSTADYDTYGLYTTESFTLPAGSYVLRLDVVASAFNLNWIEFRLATVPAPSNDNCMNAIEITDMITCNTLHPNTLGATTEMNNFTCSPNDIDVWYKFTANVTSIELKNIDLATYSATDMSIGLYSGSCTNLVYEGSSCLDLCDDAVSCEYVFDNLTVGAVYFIRIASNGANEVDFCIQALEGNICNDTPLTLDMDVVKSATYQTEQTIIAEGTIASNDNTSFKAEESITLMPGFHVQAGATFQAVIEDCTPVNMFEETPLEERTNTSEIIEKIVEDLSIVPNPFRYTTNLKYSLDQPTIVNLRIYNSSGQMINELVTQETQPIGVYEYTFTPKEAAGNFYFAVMTTPTQVITKKLIFIR